MRTRKQSGNNASETAAKILADVKARGFAAVADYTKRFDGAVITPENFAATGKELAEAEASLLSQQREAMLEMRDRIASFASAQKSMLREVAQETADGTTSLVFRPVQRAGIYVPAGRAPLFSSLFMAAVPAAEAGAKEIVICTPPQKDGKANRYILAAAKICGIRKVLKIGGAQAIGAMAYGLEGLLGPVDVICGPGNAYVNAAKMAVAGSGVRIDVPAGPSEVLVIADATANPAFVATDMLAQSEHGADSAALCICIGEKAAKEVAKQLRLQIAKLPKDNPAWQSIQKWGRIWIAGSASEAIDAANNIACEHLELMVADSEELAPLVQNAGAVFIRTAEAFCDYGMSGGNHILPTGSAARAWSGVNVQTFGKWMYVDRIGKQAQEKLAKKTALLARMEGLEAHARAAQIRGD